ncbi:MAG: glycosyltransferase family 4 protein [Ignavibacteriales bacterium]|nr:glycosyltransferase family 4 protein [Ignavibacteriales bacterium]
MNKKILLITNIPNPYRIPLFNALHNRLSEDGDKFMVAFAAEGYARRKWDNNLNNAIFDYRILKSRKIKLYDKNKTLFTYGNLINLVKYEKPDIIIVAGFSIATLKIFAFSFIKKYKFIIWSGTTINKNKKENFYRKIYRIILSKKATGFVAYGSLAKKYLISLNIPQSKINIAINTVDTEFFQNQTNKLKVNSATNNTVCFTYIGELTERKNVLEAILVIEQLYKRYKNIKFNIVGDGSKINQLKYYVNQNELTEIIIFHGYKQKEELPKILSTTDYFLFQTDFDIWGLVLVEAMSAGLICFSSINAGATKDLIIHGENGFIVDFSQSVEVATLIYNVIRHKSKYHRLGFNAQKYINENVTIKNSVEGFIEAINKI